MKRLIIGTLALLVIAGCAGGGAAIKEGSRLESEGKKAEALAVYEQKAAEMGDSDSESGREVKARAMALRKEMTDSALAEAKKKYGDRPTIASVSDAISVLNKNARYDDQERRIDDTLKKYSAVLSDLQQKQKNRLGSMESAAKDKKWSEALGLLDESLQASPDQSLVQRRQDIISERDASYKDAFTKAIAKKDWQEADKTLEAYSAESPKPSDESINKYKDDIAKLKDQVVFKKANDLVAKRKYYKAYLMLKDSKMGEGDKRMEDLCKTGAEYYKQKAADEIAKGDDRVPFAYIAVLKGMAMAPDDSDLFDLHRDIEDKLEKQIKVQIAVSTFDSPATDPDAGRRFSDELISYLVQRLPYGIEVLERSKIDLLLKESGVELKDVSRQLGAKLFIIGNVNDLNIEHKRYESKESVEGYNETTENYQYEAAAGGDEDKADKAKAGAPKAITKKIPVDIQYTKGSEKVRGNMSTSVRIFDSEKGSIAFAEQFKSAQEVEDKFQEGVNRSHVKVDADPLDLPADSEIKERIMGDMVDKVAAVVLKLFEMREWRYYENVKYRMDRRETTRAVDEAAKGYLYCVKGGIPEDNEWFGKLKQAALIDLTE